MTERLTVLVIDDDPGIRDYLETLATRQGYAVYTAADGETALRKTDADGQVKDLFSKEGMQQLVHQAIAVLPSDPIAPGARWRGVAQGCVVVVRSPRCGGFVRPRAR